MSGNVDIQYDGLAGVNEPIRYDQLPRKETGYTGLTHCIWLFYGCYCCV